MRARRQVVGGVEVDKAEGGGIAEVGEDDGGLGV